MKPAAARSRPWQVRSLCQLIGLADRSVAPPDSLAAVHALLDPEICGFMYSERCRMLSVVEGAPANRPAFRRVLGACSQDRKGG